MLDFLMISKRDGKRGRKEIYPVFIIGKTSDLMIRGGDFYAVWIEDENRWSTDEDDLIKMVDKELNKYYEEHKSEFELTPKIMYLRFSETGMIDVGADIFRRGLCLPSDNKMTAEQQDVIIEIIHRCFR